MTGPVLITLAVLAAPIDSDAVTPRSPFQSALQGDVVVRGQDASAGVIVQDPQPYATFYQTPTFAPGGGQPQPLLTDPNAGAPMFGAPMTNDPWLNGGIPTYGNPYDPYTPGGGIASAYGLNGPQPYKYGWSDRFNTGFIASAGTQTVGLTANGVGAATPNPGGDLSIFFLDFEKEHLSQLGPGWNFSFAPQYSLRLFDGPMYRRHADSSTPPVIGGTLPANPELPGAVHRFGLGLKLSTQLFNGWTIEGGFNPSIGADLRSSLGSEAWMFDGHLVGFYQASPTLTVAVGATYWDREDDMVLPYAGVVWTPSQFLEIRAVFPKPRASFFLGTPFGVPTWAYVQGEYHVESYQVDIDNPVARDLNAGGLFGVPAGTGELAAHGPSRVQLEDWRVVGGLYMEGALVTTFIEAGVVLDRSVSYSGNVRHFEVDDAFIFNMGFRY